MKKRIDDIEILRAFAVLLVVIEHVNLNLITWRTPALDRFFAYFGGWTGVDLFFAISGFVIAKDLIPRLQDSPSRQVYLNTTIVFWLRRFWRIIPSAWLWLVFILVATVFLNDSGAWGLFRHNFETVIAAFLQVANLHIAMVFGEVYPGAAFVYWSLSLEEQFYLLLPFIVLFSGRWLPWVLAAAILIQMVMVRDGLYQMMLRTDALFLGVLIALWSSKASYRLFDPEFLRSNIVLRISIIGLLLLAITTVGSDHLHIIEYRIGLIALLAAVLVLIASYDKDYISAVGLFRKPLLWIGTRSYAIYLIHIPAYQLTREFWFRFEPAGTAFNSAYTLKYLLTAAIILVVLSELNYRLVETPLRRHGVKVAKRVGQRELPAEEELAKS